MRRDVRTFRAFTHGPPEFYERAVIEHRAPPRVEPQPAAPARRPRNDVRLLPAFAIYVLPAQRA
jgi:hypothetical protein